MFGDKHTLPDRVYRYHLRLEDVSWNDILRQLGVGVKKKSGAKWLRICVFHQENTPSLHFLENQGIFHCFGCGCHGGKFKFIELYYGSKRKAFKFFKRYFGISI